LVLVEGWENPQILGLVAKTNTLLAGNRNLIFHFTDSAISDNNNHNAKKKEPDCECNLKMKMAVFWDVVLCNFVETDRRSGGTTAPMSHRPDDGGSKLL
jgi:hypothetical protein